MGVLVGITGLNRSSEIRVPGIVKLAVPTTVAGTPVAGAGLTPGTYYYKVTALGSSGETAGSSEATVVVASPANEVQHIVVDATGGDYTLTFSGQTTGNIAFDATNTAVQTALEALSNIDPGDVTVTGSAGGPYNATFGGQYADVNVAQMTANSAGLTGNTHTTTVTTTTQGSLNEKVSLTWDAVTGAASYRIYRGTSSGVENHYQTSTTNSFTDAGGVGTAGTPPTTTSAFTSSGQQLVKAGTIVIVDVDDVATRRALNNHLAVKQYVVVAVDNMAKAANGSLSALPSNS